MSPRIKKIIGLLVFLPFLLVYFFAAAALGEQVPNVQLLKAVYYMIAGVAWAFPVVFLIRWAERDRPAAKNEPPKD